MSEYLFTYGTLQPGLAPAYMAAAVDTLRPVAEGFALGLLYDLGHYPGAVLDPSSERKIHGRVFRLPEDPAILRQLDEYEEFYPDNPEASQFVRVLGSVELAGGSNLICWIYIYNRDPGRARIVEHGRFRKKPIGADL